MSLGASNSQSSSTSSVSSERISAYNNTISSLTSFISASDLQGQAYSSAKSYASSVLIPLIQGAILLSEAVSNSVSEFPNRYTSEVAGESLDSEVLEAQIATYQAAYNRTSALLESLMSKEVLNPRTISQVQSAMSRNMSKIRELQEKLDKLLAFDASSPSIFDDISSLESAVAQGLSQVNDSFSKYEGVFNIPATSDLSWAATITSSWIKKENFYKNVKEKIQKGELLTSRDIEIVQRYGKIHPNETVSSDILKAINQYNTSKGSTELLVVKEQKFSDLIDFISTNVSVGISNLAGDSAGNAVTRPIEKYGTEYAAKKATDIWKNRFSTELKNGHIMGKTPGATKAAIDASNDAILGSTKVASTVLGEGSSFIGGTAVGVGINMMQGDSAEEAFGKEITTGVVSGIGTAIAVATLPETVPVVLTGIVIGTSVSYFNEWATKEFPELEEFEDSVGQAVVDTWNSLTKGTKDYLW